MIAKYHIQYGVRLGRHEHTHDWTTDDPVACEEFLMELLDRSFHIHAIRHEGVALPQADFDRMIKTAAGMLAARRVCASLGIDAEEEQFRFGFSA